MKKKITVLCSIIIALSVCVAVFGATGGVKTDVTTATAKVFYAENEESTTSTGSSFEDLVGDIVGGMGSESSGGIGEMLGGIGSGSFDVIGDGLGGIGEALGGISSGFGDALGGIFGGLGGSGTGAVVNTTAPDTTSADIGLIIPVPAATQTTTEAAILTTESAVAGETVDYASTSNPYTKPTAGFTAGDEDETIKWLQWIFIYSGYGLKDNGITGILDEDTVAVVKKLQHQNQLTVDGNVTEEVIKAAEALYYQSILGEDVSAIEVQSQATTSVNGTNQATDTGDGNSIPVALLIIVLVIIWVLAIGGIILLFVFKKKKSEAQKEEKKESEEKTEGQQSEKKETISSIADLFEEAEKNSK